MNRANSNREMQREEMHVNGMEELYEQGINGMWIVELAE
jgi:hypothetical protein